MEIDLSHLEDHQWTALWVGLGLVVLVALALLGRTYTSSERLLTRQEWQIRKAERLHESEHSLLCQQTHHLAEGLSDPAPEAIRAALIARQVLAKAETVQSLPLEPQQAALIAAAQAVVDWGTGLLDYNTAVGAVMEALRYCEP